MGSSYEAIFEVDPTDTIYRGQRGIADWLTAPATVSVPDAKGFGSMANLAVDMSNDFELAEVVQSSTDAMATPTLKSVREAATPVFGSWSQSLELTRELTPVLIASNEDGTQLIDHAIYQEDAEGGFWTLASGAPVTDSSANSINRPHMQQVLDQATTPGLTWRLEQAFSPTSRSNPVAFRENTAYLATEVDGRLVVHDYAQSQEDGSWQLTQLRHQDGAVIRAETLAQLTSVIPTTAPNGANWQSENIGHNVYANLPADRMGVQLVDGVVTDYTVQITDIDGPFHVWARNLDRALELQHVQGRQSDFQLRNYEVDLNALDEVGSTDDSAYRVEVLTAGQFHFASSIFGIDFQPQVMHADTDPTSGLLSYSVGSFNGESLASMDEEGNYVSSILPAIEMFDGLMQNYIDVSRAFSVRLALQRGLSHFARELSYDANTDEFRATGNRELAPMFEAIFEQAPDGEQESYGLFGCLGRNPGSRLPRLSPKRIGKFCNRKNASESGVRVPDALAGIRASGNRRGTCQAFSMRWVSMGPSSLLMLRKTTLSKVHEAKTTFTCLQAIRPTEVVTMRTSTSWVRTSVKT